MTKITGTVGSWVIPVSSSADPTTNRTQVRITRHRHFVNRKPRNVVLIEWIMNFWDRESVFAFTRRVSRFSFAFVDQSIVSIVWYRRRGECEERIALTLGYRRMC